MTKTQKTVLFAFGLVLLGALLYRIRGGFLPTGSTQLARAIWALPTGVMCALVVPNISLVQRLLVGTGSSVMAFVGLFLPNTPWDQIGAPGNPVIWWWVEGALVSALRLALILLPTLALVRMWGLLAFAAVGAITPGLYFLGAHLFLLPPIVDWYTAWGELFFGGLVWGVTFLVLRKA